MAANALVLPDWLAKAYAQSQERFRWRERRSIERDASQFPAAIEQQLLATWDEKFDPEATRVVWANVWARETVKDLKNAHVHRAFDEQRIRDYAENYSRLAARITSFCARAEFTEFLGVALPTGHGLTESGAMARMGDPLWWRRQLRKVWTRAAENGMRDIGAIRKGRAPYASDDAVRHRRAQKRRMREFLEGHHLVNETGEQLSLIDVAEKSLANPALRRGEFMTRVRGFEEIAADLGPTCRA